MDSLLLSERASTPLPHHSHLRILAAVDWTVHCRKHTSFEYGCNASVKSSLVPIATFSSNWTRFWTRNIFRTCCRRWEHTIKGSYRWWDEVGTGEGTRKKFINVYSPLADCYSDGVCFLLVLIVTFARIIRKSSACQNNGTELRHATVISANPHCREISFFPCSISPLFIRAALFWWFFSLSFRLIGRRPCRCAAGIPRLVRTGGRPD